MALKKLSVLNSNVGSYRRNKPQAGYRHGPARRTSGGPLLQRVVRPIRDPQAARPGQTERAQNHDYEIALVPRSNRKRRIRSLRHRSATTNRVLLLPLTWRQLLRRVRRTLSPKSVLPAAVLRFGEVRIDFLTMEVHRSEKPVTFTAQQFKLLKFFTRTPERVISRDELLNEVWGYKNYPSTRTVDNHVWVLRQKLEPDPAHPIHFLTVHGTGYRFVP